MSTLLVECAAGDDGGLKQHFNLEVYLGDSAVTAAAAGAANQQQQARRHLHSNLSSSSQPNFMVSNLTPGTAYTLILYASNAKGRSHIVSLPAVTLSPPEKHMSSRGT